MKKKLFKVSLFDSNTDKFLVKSDDNTIIYKIKEYTMKDMKNEFKQIKNADESRIFFYNIEKNIENLILENKNNTKKLLMIMWNFDIVKKIIDFFIENHYKEMLNVKKLLYNYKWIKINDEDFSFYFVDFLYSYIKLFIRNAFIKLIKKWYEFDNIIYLLLYSSIRENKKENFRKMKIDDIIFDLNKTNEKINEIKNKLKNTKNYTFWFLNNFIKNYLVKIRKDQEADKKEFTFSELWIENLI